MCVVTNFAFYVILERQADGLVFAGSSASPNAVNNGQGTTLAPVKFPN